jgi:hypothetical protein
MKNWGDLEEVEKVGSRWKIIKGKKFDEDQLLEIYYDALTDFAYEVVEKGHLIEAVDQWRREHFERDVVFRDPNTDKYYKFTVQIYKGRKDEHHFIKENSFKEVKKVTKKVEITEWEEVK